MAIPASAGDTRSWPGSEAAGGPGKRGDGRARWLLYRSRRRRAGRHLRIRGSRRQNRHLLRSARKPWSPRPVGRPRADGSREDDLGRRLHRQGRGDQRVGAVVRTVPHRDHPAAEGVRRHARAGRRVPRHRRSRQQYERSSGFYCRPQGHVPVHLRPADAQHDRLRRQVPDHRHPVHRGAGPRAPGRRRLPPRTARRGPAAGRGEAGGRAGAEDVTGFTEIAPAGPLLTAFGVCVLAGLVSFASPCVVPLVPGYLSYLAAVVGVEEEPRLASPSGDRGLALRTARLRVAGAALLFVAGFTFVFVLGTVAVLGMTTTLISNQLLLQRIGGVITILMGLVFVGFIPALQREARFTPRQISTLGGAPLLGAVFGLGWTPSLGPTPPAVIAVAPATHGASVARGAALGTAYCMGLGIPIGLL